MSKNLMSGVRLDEDDREIRTYLDTDEHRFLLTQISGYGDNFRADFIRMTNEEFYGMFPSVWIVEIQFGHWSEGPHHFHGLFHTEEGAKRKLIEVIEGRLGYDNITINESPLFLNGKHLKSYEYLDKNDNLYTTYQIPVNR